MKNGIRLMLLAGVAMPAAPLAAQDSDAAQGDAQASSGEIVVTARKREERLIDVPAGASVISAERVEERGGATNVVDLLAGQPGVRVLDTASPLTNEISLRGSPTTRGTSGDPAVGLFRDGAYIGGGGFSGRAFARIDMFDIDRVEVLRGTQGALYGRNAIGGAVNIVSARPEFTNSGWASLRYAAGNDQLQAQGAVNVDLGGGFAMRLGADYVTQRTGFIKNSFLGGYLDDNESTGVRGQLRWKNDTTDILLRAEHWKGEVPAISFRIFIEPRQGFPVGLVQPERSYPWSTDAFSRQEINSGLLRIDHDFGWGRLRSITNLRQRKASYAFDQDGGNLRDFQALRAAGIVTINQDSGLEQQREENAKFLTQDLNLTGTAFGDKLTWMVGGEYLRLKAESEQRNLRTPTTANPSLGTRQPLEIDVESWAAYGSLDLALTDRFSVIGEARYTEDTRSAESARFDLTSGLPSGGTRFIVDRTTRPTNFNYNATAAWKLAPDILFYGKVGTSFRAGGFNDDLGVPQQPVQIPGSYDDETVTSYELGLKGTVLERLTFGIAAYQNEAENIIVQLNNGCFVGNPVCNVNGTSFSNNAGDARTRGIEAEANATLPIHRGRIRLGASVSHQRGEATAGPFDGQNLPQIPRWIFGIDMSVRRELTESTSLFVNVNYNGQRGGVHDLVAPNTPPPFDMDRIDVMNARIALENSGFQLSVFATNLTDETFDIFRGASARRLNQPANYGVQFMYRW
jgi:iron complex outermembrane receptor protein